MEYFDILRDLRLAVDRGYISFSKLGEDYLLAYNLELSSFSEKINHAVDLIDHCLDNARSKTYLEILNLAYDTIVKNPESSILSFLESVIESVTKKNPFKKLDTAVAPDGTKVYGDIYFIPRDVFLKLDDCLDTITSRFGSMIKSGSINNLITDLGYSSIDEFKESFLNINSQINSGALNKYLGSKHFYTIFNLERNKIITWLDANFFEVHNVMSLDAPFIIAIFFDKEGVSNLAANLEIIFSNFISTNQLKEKTLNSASLFAEFKEWIRRNGSIFFKEGIGKKVYDIIIAAMEEAISDEIKRLEAIGKAYNVYDILKNISIKKGYYNYFIGQQYQMRYEVDYIKDVQTIVNIMNSFLNARHNDFVKNNKLNTDVFFKAFSIYLADFMTDDKLVKHFALDELDSIKEDFKMQAAKDGSTKLKVELSKLLHDKMLDNEEFSKSYYSSDGSVYVDISRFISDDEKRIILLWKNSAKNVYSFKKSIEVIKKSIEDLKKRKSHRVEKIVPRAILDQFFDRLEEILIRQLKQEDLFLQGKTGSTGMLDQIKPSSNLKIRKVNINSVDIGPNAFLSYISDDNFFKVYESFHKQFFDNFNNICLYFELFKDEAIQFFSNNDINSIKSSILKLLNFLNSKTSANENAANTISKTYDLNSKIYIRNEMKSLYTIDIVGDIFKDNKNITKKEYLQRIQNPLQLLHNFSTRAISNEILESETFKKTYNPSIFQLQNIAIPTLENINHHSTFHDLVENGKIPSEYITDNIKNFFKVSRGIHSGKDYDIAMNYLIGDGSSEAIRKAKFVLGYIQGFSNISNWMKSAKPKDSAIFAANLETEKFRFRVLKDLDPLHFSVGVETDCCQAIGGAGEAAAIDSFINPYAGVLLLESKIKDEWELAAQSYFHYANVESGERAIILDNIEAGKFEKLHSKDFYRNAYATLGAHLSKSGFKIVGCGKDYTNVIGSGDFDIGSIEEDPRHFEIEKHNEDRYTDFDNESFYDLTKPKFDFKQSENIIENEGELSKLSVNILSLYVEKYGSNIAKKILKTSQLLEIYGFKKEAMDIVNIAAIK